MVEHIADEVMVMYLGRCVEMGTKEQIFKNPQHPYTQALLSATPRLSPELRRQRIKLTGELPSQLIRQKVVHLIRVVGKQRINVEMSSLNWKNILMISSLLASISIRKDKENDRT